MWLLVISAQLLVRPRKVVSVSMVLTLGKVLTATRRTSGCLGKRCWNQITFVPWKGPHTMVMTLARLQSWAASLTGDLCQCACLLQETCRQCDTPLKDHLEKAASVVAKKLQIGSSTAYSFLGDLTVMSLNMQSRVKLDNGSEWEQFPAFFTLR